MKHTIYEDPVTHKFALLRLPIRFVEGDKLPEPLATTPSETLIETDKLTVLGFPEGTELVKSLGEGLGVLREDRIEALVFGSIAANKYGRPEDPEDIDFLLRPADASAALDALGATGSRRTRPSKDGFSRRGRTVCTASSGT